MKPSRRHRPVLEYAPHPGKGTDAFGGDPKRAAEQLFRRARREHPEWWEYPPEGDDKSIPVELRHAEGILELFVRTYDIDDASRLADELFEVILDQLQTNAGDEGEEWKGKFESAAHLVDRLLENDGGTAMPESIPASPELIAKCRSFLAEPNEADETAILRLVERAIKEATGYEVAEGYADFIEWGCVEHGVVDVFVQGGDHVLRIEPDENTIFSLDLG